MPDTSDRKFQDGDFVICNHWMVNPDSERRPSHDQDAVVLSVYTSAGRGKDGDWAYNIEVSQKKIRNTVWGYQLRHAMFKYDPKQAGDTEEDI